VTLLGDNLSYLVYELLTCNRFFLGSHSYLLSDMNDNKPRICVDFDGTIYDGVAIFPDCVEVLTTLRQRYIIAIFSARATPAERNQMIAILNEHRVPYDEVLPPKPAAELYIDDCGRHFTSWKSIAELLSAV
jgi:ribonucleotide monophosphatase NagD (HAD superfamily)